MPNPIQGALSVGYLNRLGQDRYAAANRSTETRPLHGAAGMAGDQLEISAGARSMGSLLRTWDTLSWLFGRRTGQGAGSPPLPDLNALRETLAEARKNLETMRTRQGVTETLKSSALQQAEALVQQAYGLWGDGAPLKVVFEEDMGGALAAVSYEYDRHGRMADQQLHLSMNQFVPDYGPNGKNDHVIENDRIIAHEMTHAIMGRNIDMSALPDWFAEGTAEYVAGGAERVGIVLKRYTPERMMARLAQPWQGDTTQYAASYVAVRYLDQATQEGGGIKAIMASLKAGNSLDQAIHSVSKGQFEDTGSFVSHVVQGAGAAFIKSVDMSGKDPGSIKPGRGPDIVPDQGTRSNQPLKGFKVAWPSPLEGISFPTPAPWFGGLTPTMGAAAYQRQMPR